MSFINNQYGFAVGESEISSSVLMGDKRKFVHFSPGLVVACLNVNSLTGHIDELRVFMSDANIDILAITES